MGLFSKKTYVCEKCGKEFETRKKLSANIICDDCFDKELNEREELEDAVSGYVAYYDEVFYKSYSLNELKKIIAHRDNLLAKFKNDSGISRAELERASENYKNLTDDQAAEVLKKMATSTIIATRGAAYSGTFFCPTEYEGMIVDAGDVFAVGYTTDINYESDIKEAILCVAFTNDPYVPVFPMVYVGKKGLFEFKKSKKGREGVEALFESMCPNLKYPVCELRKLKKQIKQEGEVNGKVDSKFMLEQMDDAINCSGFFDTEKMGNKLISGSAAMLDSIGYIQDIEQDDILKMDKMFNRNYWNKQIKRISGE